MGKIKDLLGNPEQLDKVTKMAFKQVDTDGSGTISKSELEALMRKVAGDCQIKAPTSSDVDDAMKAIDTNGDGQISCDEFKLLVIGILSAIAAQEK